MLGAGGEERHSLSKILQCYTASNAATAVATRGSTDHLEEACFINYALELSLRIDCRLCNL